MAGRFANTQILNPNVTPIPQIMADPRLQNNRSDVFVFRDADLPSDYFEINPFSPINKEYPVKNVAPLSDEVAGNIRDAVFGKKQEDVPAKDILIQAAKNDIARNREANEEIKSLNPRDGRELRQGKVPEEKSMVFDAGDSLKHYFDTDPFNPNPVRNVAPFSDETNRTIKDSVFGKDEDNGFNDRVISAYQEKMLGPSKKVSNKELIDAVKRDDGKKAIISEAKGSPKTIDVEPKKEDFKARAKKSVRDWTDNSGMQYIAQVNPYAAAGMGFANQMANPFKQKYFEDRADANEEEDARRLNYEIGRQAKLDKIAEEDRKRQREIEDYIPSVETPSTLGVRGVNVEGFNKDIADILARNDISNPIKRKMIAERVARIRKEISGAERGFNLNGIGPIAPAQDRWMSGLHMMGLWKSAEGYENESLRKQIPGARVLQLTQSQEELFLKNNPGLLEAVNNIESSTGAYARIIQKPDGRIVIGMFDPEKNSFIRIFDPQEMRSEKGIGMQEDRIVQGLLDE